MMKKRIAFTVVILFVTLISCNKSKTYSEQFNTDKPFVSRILDLNKSLEEIRLEEKGTLITENIDLLKFVYDIGKNDTYVVSYLFDEKGCFEIGIDGYFEFEKDAIDVVTGIRTVMGESAYGKGTADNNLNQWKNEDKSISIELDYKNTSRGLFIATIFANN